ncbi:MAG: YdeI/OmpD-associated family protein [Propionibacteriaceae bacterium]
MTAQHYTTTVADDGRGGAFIDVPFDPDAIWGAKARHHIAGTVNGIRIRGAVELNGEVRGFRLGPAWLRDGTVRIGDEVGVEIQPEGPQRGDLASDVASALDAHPEAGDFFDSLAQFYRRAYLRWVDATKRSPELRAQRISTMVDLLSAGVKDYRQR